MCGQIINFAARACATALSSRAHTSMPRRAPARTLLNYSQLNTSAPAQLTSERPRHLQQHITQPGTRPQVRVDLQQSHLRARIARPCLSASRSRAGARLQFERAQPLSAPQIQCALAPRDAQGSAAARIPPRGSPAPILRTASCAAPAYVGCPVQIRTVTARARHILTQHPSHLRDSGVGTPMQQ